jgi:hypothetical protein
MLVQDADGERLDFAERDGLESARALQPQVEAANASEKREDAIGHLLTPRAAASICSAVASARSNRATSHSAVI